MLRLIHFFQSKIGLRLKDENGNPSPLRRYSGETVVISLPDDKTIYDFDWLGVWCEEFNVDFGSVRIPQHVRVPPSPKMLGIKPEVSPKERAIVTLPPSKRRRKRPNSRGFRRNGAGITRRPRTRTTDSHI